MSDVFKANPRLSQPLDNMPQNQFKGMEISRTPPSNRITPTVTPTVTPHGTPRSDMLNKIFSA